MLITEIKIRKTFTKGKLKAIISATLNDCIAIHELKIIQGNNRLFVAMPSRMDNKGVFRDIIHPITPAARAAFENAVINAYERYISTIEKVNDFISA